MHGRAECALHHRRHAPSVGSSTRTADRNRAQVENPTNANSPLYDNARGFALGDSVALLQPGCQVIQGGVNVKAA